MSTLTLVRHGQAHAFEEDSDRLTPLGVEQMRRLGEYWARHNVRHTHAVSGTLRRHRESAEALRNSGFALPEIEADARWNEYPAREILEHLLPAAAAADVRMAELRTAWIESQAAERNRHFQRLLEPLMAAWLSGALAHPEVETAAAFRARVKGALVRILDGPSGRDVVVFTSGGPIGVCVQETLGAPLGTFLDVNWRVNNASLTEFTFSRGRIALDRFNDLAHLDDWGMRSWR